jgi:hypothetical protein
MESLKVKESNEIDWRLLLTSWDIAKYFPKFDLIELSQYNKFMRKRLSPFIFKNIILNNFSDGLDDLPLEVESAEVEKEALDRYDEHLKYLYPHVRSLIYEYDYNEVLLLCIPQVFSNLNRLQLTNVSVTLTSFHKLMSGLKQLEHLFLGHPLFIVSDTSEDPVTLQLPSKLITFKIIHGELMRTEFDSSLVFSDYLEYSNESNTGTLKFDIEKGSLPNLKILEIDMDDQNFMESRISLVSASNQLTHFSTKLSLICDFSSVHFKSLTSLTLTNNFQFPRRLLDYTFPALENLKEFRIMGGFNLTEYDELIIPSIKKLLNIGKNAERLTFPYIQIDRLSIDEVIQSFPNLKDLTLVKASDVVTLSPIKLPNTVKVLNLFNFNPKFIELNSIKDSIELKILNIAYENENLNYFEFDENELVKDIEGWRVIRFYGSSIKCYKE